MASLDGQRATAAMAVSRASQTQASSSLCPRLLLEPVVVVTNAGRQPACGIDTMQVRRARKQRTSVRLRSVAELTAPAIGPIPPTLPYPGR